jgi:hypothetical protein
VSGAALNPARAIAPQLAAASTKDWWVYWLGPIVAAVVVWLAQRWIHQPVPLVTIDQPTNLDQAAEGDTANAYLKAKAKEAMATLGRTSAAKTNPKQSSPTKEKSSDDAPSPPPTADFDSPAADQAAPLQPTFSPDEAEEEEQPTVAEPTAARRKPLPRPSAVRFVDFDQPVDISQNDED